MNLSSRVALIAGGGRAIGSGISRCLARGGADIVIVYRRHLAAAEATAAAVRALAAAANSYAVRVARALVPRMRLRPQGVSSSSSPVRSGTKPRPAWRPKLSPNGRMDHGQAAVRGAVDVMGPVLKPLNKR